MKNFISKIFLSTLIISAALYTPCHANETTFSVDMGYESTTPFVMPTYQPQSGLTSPYNTPEAAQESAPKREMQIGKTIARSLSRLILNIPPITGIGELVPGWIHRARCGDDELLHSEEVMEWILSGSCIGGGITYPFITASTAERIIVPLLTALIAAKIDDPKVIPFALGAILPNLLASLQMAKRKKDNPETKGWELKQSKIWWQLLYSIPCLIGGMTISNAFGYNSQKTSDSSSDTENGSYFNSDSNEDSGSDDDSSYRSDSGDY